MQKEISGPLDRYLSILELVAASHRGLTLTEITTLLKLPKPTAHRLVGALRDVGALDVADERHKTFGMGQRIWKILMLSQDDRVVKNYSQLVCDELAGILGETCYVVRLGPTSAETLTVATTDHGYRLHVVPGSDLPLHAAAAAKVLLAYQDEESQRRYLIRPLTKLTSHTKTNVDDVLDDLRKARDKGYAVCNREIEPDVMAYACPVVLPGGVFYSVGVTGPCSRLEEFPAEHWIEPLGKASSKLSLMLKSDLSPGRRISS